MTDPILIYGSYGYTGQLVVAEAQARGHTPLLAGRDAGRLREQATATGLAWQAVALDDPDALDRLLADAALVIHCAGPFARTARPMADACLRTGTQYLDITGEIEVFEQLAGRSDAAREAGIVLLPGTGFDVVPSDSLAAHLKQRLPEAERLVLAIRGGGRLSRGTATTMAENAGAGGAVRKHGRIIPVPAAWKSRMIDYGDGPQLAVTIPWGDVSTAWYTTGIPDIEVYSAMTPATRRKLRLTRWLGPVLRLKPVRKFLRKRIAAAPPGPSERTRERTTSEVWGEALAPDGRSVRALIRGPNGYALTAMTAVRIAERCLESPPAPGFHTPAGAFGADFVLEIPGVERHDL